MVAAPDSHYARDGGVHFAYQVLGDHGPDLLLVPSPNFPIDLSGVIPPLVLGAGIVFHDRGSHELKGVPNMWPIFAVRGD
jgi:hypothetical protein